MKKRFFIYSEEDGVFISKTGEASLWSKKNQQYVEQKGINQAMLFGCPQDAAVVLSDIPTLSDNIRIISYMTEERNEEFGYINPLEAKANEMMNSTSYDNMSLGELSPKVHGWS